MLANQIYQINKKKECKNKLRHIYAHRSSQSDHLSNSTTSVVQYWIMVPYNGMSVRICTPSNKVQTVQYYYAVASTTAGSFASTASSHSSLSGTSMASL